MKKNYIKSAEQYYTLLQRINYGVEYFKYTPSRDKKIEAAYVSLLNNLASAYDNFVKEKKSKSLKIYDFREVLNIPDANGSFIIHKGQVMGDIIKAKDWAELKLKESDPLKNNYIYELALYVSLCTSKEKKEYIKIPEELVSEIKKPVIELVYEASKEASKIETEVSIFDIFSI